MNARPYAVFVMVSQGGIETPFIKRQVAVRQIINFCFALISSSQYRPDNPNTHEDHTFL
jgi:hypothetical protein